MVKVNIKPTMLANPILTKSRFSPGQLKILSIFLSTLLMALTSIFFLPRPSSPAEVSQAELALAATDLTAQILQIDTNLITLEEKQYLLQREIKNTEKQIADLNLLLTDLERNLQSQQLKFAAFLRWHYIFAGELLCLSALDLSSWSDFIFSLNYLLVLLEKQSDSLHRLETTIATHKQKQEEMLSLLATLKQKQAEYNSLHAEYLARKAEINRLSETLRQQSPLISTYFAELTTIRRQIISDLKTYITSTLNKSGNISWIPIDIFSLGASGFQITQDIIGPSNFTNLQIKPEVANKYIINGTYLSGKQAYSFNISVQLKFNEDNTLLSIVDSFIINGQETIKNGEFLIFSL